MDLLIDRQDLHRTALVDTAPPAPLTAGQVRLELECFALTSNNITYAVAGDMLDYWGFFPAEAPWGRIPVMGVGRVVESTEPDIAVGGRYFGFFPMSTHHVVDAVATTGGFGDRAAHRAQHAGAYRSFSLLSADPAYSEETEAQYLLVRGLFLTSFLIDDHLADEGLLDGAAVIITSASSKTSIALAHCARQREGSTIVGLTSAGNRAFVESLGLYDEVVTYDAIEAIDAHRPSVLVDMAGNADVRSALHLHLADLRASISVGATHWSAGGGAVELPGPAPAFFFAPSQMAKRSAEWGREEFDARVATALGAFVEHVAGWMTVERTVGGEAVEQLYRQMLDGESDPAVGHIATMQDPA